MRWLLVALVISCAHDPPRAAKTQAAPAVVLIDASTDVVEAEAEIVDAAIDADDARPRWHALLDGMSLVNVEHVRIAPLARSPRARIPSVRVADVRTTGLIEARAALRALRSRMLPPQVCYELELRTAPDLDAVRVKLRLAVVASGDVVFAEASGSAPESLLRCIERAFVSMSVPPPSVLSAIETTLLFDEPRR